MKVPSSVSRSKNSACSSDKFPQYQLQVSKYIFISSSIRDLLEWSHAEFSHAKCCPLLACRRKAPRTDRMYPIGFFISHRIWEAMLRQALQYWALNIKIIEFRLNAELANSLTRIPLWLWQFVFHQSERGWTFMQTRFARLTWFNEFHDRFRQTIIGTNYAWYHIIWCNFIDPRFRLLIADKRKNYKCYEISRNFIWT